MKNCLGRTIKGTNKTIKKELTDSQIEFLGPHANNFLTYLEEIIQNDASEESELQETLDATLEEMGFTGESRAKCKSLFVEAVNRNTTKLQDGIAKLVGQYFSIEGSDVVDALFDRIQELEEAIATVEAEKEQLANEHVAKLSERYSLDESVVENLWAQSNTFDELENRLQQIAKPERRTRRSTVEERMEELNEDGAFAEVDGHVTQQMAQYLRYLK